MRLDAVTTATALPIAPRPGLPARTRQHSSAPEGATAAPEAAGRGPARLGDEGGSRRERLEAVIADYNKRLSRAGRRVDIYIVDDTNQVAARVIDTESNKVVRYIPPEEILELRARLDELAGLLFDKDA
jgi:flagellar protein FlaG